MKSEYGHKPIRTESTGTKPTPAKELAALKAAIELIIKQLQQLTKPAARDKGDDLLS